MSIDLFFFFPPEHGELGQENRKKGESNRGGMKNLSKAWRCFLLGKTADDIHH